MPFGNGDHVSNELAHIMHLQPPNVCLTCDYLAKTR
jgi:hypothetical protein